MSPILTRPIREQLEHDRIIRQLQARYKRKHEVVINPGPEQNHSVMVGELAVYPDLLLYSQERSRRLEGTVEVETGESVNQLEALAEWGVFSKLKAPFHLYVPPQSIDSARRICEEQQFPVAEIWTYHSSLDQVRFTQVYRSPAAIKAAAAAARSTNDKPPADQGKGPARKSAKPAPAPTAKTAAKPTAKTAAKPTAKAAPKAVKANSKNSKAAKASASTKSSSAKGAAKPARAAKPAKPSAGKRTPVGKKRR